jgi:heme-degrading monooxygenase HmoA
MDWRLRRFLLCSFPRQRQLVAVCIALADTRSEHVGLSGRSRWGARVYNAIHSYGAPAALALCALLLRTPAPLPFALIWLNHIGVDRLLGYGLKYPHGFAWTHLGILGAKHKKGAAHMLIATTPAIPYYAVIFTSIRTEEDNGYGEMANAMVELAAKQLGFLGVESAREGLGITVSYWESLEAIAAWKQNSAHLTAQKHGRETWYRAFKTRICRVERDYNFQRE